MIGLAIITMLGMLKFARTILWRVGVAVAPRGKQPQAIALVQALTIAVMIGVPFGSFGFAWRAVFGVMSLAIITMLGMLKFVPDVSLQNLM